MVVSLGRFMPKNVGTRIADFNRTKSSNLSQVFHKYISSEGTPKPLRKEPAAAAHHFHTHQAPAIKPSIHPHRTFSTASHDMWRQKLNRGAQSILEESQGIVHFKRGFSTQANIDMWRKVIKSDPSYLVLPYIKDLSSKSLENFVFLIEKEGIIIDKIRLPCKGLSKEFISTLLIAISKWQEYLPGSGVINIKNNFTNPLSHYKIFFESSPSVLKEIEQQLVENEYPKIWVYEVQRIPLDKNSIDRFSDYIMNIYHDNIVFLMLKNDPKLLMPKPINPLTNEEDLTPLII